MDLTRIIDPQHLDHRLQRLTNVAFKRSTGIRTDAPDGKAGLSVFDTKCACPDLNGDCLCRHIAQYYSLRFPEPCVFWTFDFSILDSPNPNPDDIPSPVLVDVPSDTGDECHRNIHFLSPGRAKKLLYHNTDPPELHLHICIDGKVQPFSWDLAAKLLL